MARRAILAGLVITMASPSGASSQVVPPVARTEAGSVRDVRDGTVERFLGIPYAAPPIGPLRWRAPQAPRPWASVRAGTSYGNDCMQQPFPSDAAPLGTAPAEDCLTVNVWRPRQCLGCDSSLIELYGCVDMYKEVLGLTCNVSRGPLNPARSQLTGRCEE